MTSAIRLRVLAAVICGALAGARMHAQALPDASTILDRFVAVTGGRSAYESHHSEILSGTIDFPAQGLKGKLIRYLAPKREYSAVELEGLGLLESGILGDVSWDKNPIQGPRLRQGAEKDQAMREAYLNGPLFWRDLYPKATTASIQTIGGQECYEVVLTPPVAPPEHRFFSKQTGLLVRTTTRAVTPMGDANVEVDVSDYKLFSGVLTPTRIQQRVASLEQTITVDNIRVNEAIPDDRFSLPPDIAELLKQPEPSASGH